MNTTNLFVELIVIGIGAFIWIALLIFAVFGYAWVPIDKVFSSTLTIPFLTAIYVLGIISDRIADVIFEWLWSDDLRETYFSNRLDYYNARRVILLHSERLSDLMEYGRSRLRICRGWAFHLVLIAPSLNIFLLSQELQKGMMLKLAVLGTIFSLVLAFGAWFSWKRLALSEYRKAKEQSEFLIQHGHSG